MQICKNRVLLSGEITGEVAFSHESYEVKFFKAYVAVKRLSHVVDTIPVIFSDRMIDVSSLAAGARVVIEGRYSSYMKHIGDRRHLELFVLCNAIDVIGNTDETDVNCVEFTGFICKEPVYRETPLGRQITDVIMAVNSPHKKSDYIPCICWSRDAKYAAYLNVGDNVAITGRIQSREYVKKLEDGTEVTGIAYEVSVGSIDRVEEKYED